MSIDEPKVSIIIPVYNVKSYLEESLDSVINQTYKNLEIIIVDDGSNDGSEKICDEYAKKDNRIKLIHRKNGGLSAARNTGLDNMNGDYVAFLDSDDAFIPETIEKSLNAMLTNDVNCVMYMRSSCSTGKDGKLKEIAYIKTKPLLQQRVYSRIEALRALANLTFADLAWNKLYKREIWEDLRFPEGKVYEDLYTIFHVIERVKNIYILHDKLVMYRFREGSISATKSLESIKNYLDAWLYFENYIETHTPEIFEEGQINKTRKKVYRNLMMCYSKVLSMQNSEKSKILNLLKEHIKKYENLINIKDYNIGIRLVHFLMSHDSVFVQILYPYLFKIYKNIKNIVLR